jgi:hypothetical protein
MEMPLLVAIAKRGTPSPVERALAKRLLGMRVTFSTRVLKAAVGQTV